MSASAEVPLVKPRLRGVSHQIACVVSLLAGALLVMSTHDHDAYIATIVYVICLASLFGISASYHRPTWQPNARAWMRRLDHCAIFLLVAGTYTPLSLALAPHDGQTLRRIVWGGAIAGILQSLLWVTAPKPLIAVIYVVLGWSVLPYIPRLYALVGGGPLALIVVGGIAYSVGAVVYARKRPDPWPTMFGYHEVFHALVILAAALHFAAITWVTSMRT
jgi:hemolysin III